jgi:predicted secreted acid phosphatase
MPTKVTRNTSKAVYVMFLLKRESAAAATASNNSKGEKIAKQKERSWILPKTTSIARETRAKQESSQRCRQVTTDLRRQVSMF